MRPGRGALAGCGSGGRAPGRGGVLVVCVAARTGGAGGPRTLASRDVEDAIGYYVQHDAQQTALAFVGALGHDYVSPRASRHRNVPVRNRPGGTGIQWSA